MSDHLEDEKQMEMMKVWWQENGTVLLFALFMIIGSHFGWQKWQSHKLKVSHAASVQYQQVLSGADTPELSDVRHSGYASLLAFQQAKKAVENHHLDDAKTQLIWVVNHADSPYLKQLARLRAARILLEQKHYDHATLILKKEENKTFLPIINQVRGDIALAQKQTDQAKVFYEQAYAAWPTNSPARVYLQMQLSELK